MIRSLRTAHRVVVRVIRLGTVVSVGLAVEQELSKPRERRTWYGSVGPVPYNFRRPLRARLKRESWQPDSRESVIPRAFGLGWGLNFGRLAGILRRGERR